MEPAAPMNLDGPTRIGIRELKARCSEYIDRAAAGELITITKRGVPVVTIGAVRGESRLERGIRQGWIRPALQPHREGFVPPRYPARPGAPSLQEILDEDREDRF